MTDLTEPVVQDPNRVMEVTEGFVTEINGARFVGVKGRTRVPANHPAVRAYPEFFGEVEPTQRYEVEDMTADPGRRRGRPPSRPAAAGEPKSERQEA